MNETQHRLTGSRAKQVGLRDLESGSQAAEPVWATASRDKSPWDPQKQDRPGGLTWISRSLQTQGLWCRQQSGEPVPGGSAQDLGEPSNGRALHAGRGLGSCSSSNRGFFWSWLCRGGTERWKQTVRTQ